MPDDEDGGGTEFGPFIPPHIDAKLTERYIGYPETYQTLAFEFGINIDPPADSNGPDSGEVNQARQHADDLVKEVQKSDPSYQPVDAPMGQVPVTYLPTESDTGKALSIGPTFEDDDDDDDDSAAQPDDDPPAGPTSDDADQAINHALVLTSAWLLWQMYGTALALTVTRCTTFREHGGRPPKG